MFKKHHVCHPNIVRVLGVRKEIGGEGWLISAEDFDRMFCGEVVWNLAGVTWGIKQISHSEAMKIYRQREEE